MSGKLDVPGNLTLVSLPAKCPELNPTENIWEFMRDNWLSNRVFLNADDLLDHLLRGLEQTPKPAMAPLMSIGMRDWAHEVLINDTCSIKPLFTVGQPAWCYLRSSAYLLFIVRH